MQAVTLIFCILAISISSMDLSLAIIWGRKASSKWSKFLIVFASTLLGVVFSYAIVQFSYLFENTLAVSILRYVWDILFHVDVGFLIMFIPLFINWVIARPMPVFETVLFSLITALYSACYVLSVFFTWSVLVYLEYISFVLVIIYTIAIMAMNYTKSDRKSVRAVTITIISVSSLVLCLFILTFIFPMISPMMLPLVALLYFIMLLVFLFVAVVNQEKRTEKKNEEIADEKNRLKDEIIEKFHITDREFEIIKLIKAGLTNKEIGGKLNISVNTVNNHIANIFSKTGVRCRIDLLNLFEEASW